jgi:hypothetical protein
MINDIFTRSKINEIKQKHKIANDDSANVSELLNKLNNLPEDSNEINFVKNLLNSAQDKARNSISDTRVSLFPALAHRVID